jgi:magnesium-protoporphyrin O-methyltransferase
MILKKVGELFPGPSKATRAYLHSEDEVRGALANAGFRVTRSTRTATSFYFSTLIEAVRA